MTRDEYLAHWQARTGHTAEYLESVYAFLPCRCGKCVGWVRIERDRVPHFMEWEARQAKKRGQP